MGEPVEAREEKESGEPSESSPLPPLQDDDPVILPLDQGRRFLRWMLGFGGWMGCVVGALLLSCTALPRSDSLLLSSTPAALFICGVVAIYAHRKSRKASEDDF